MHSLDPYAGINQSWRSIRVGWTAVVGADIQPRGHASGHQTLDLHQVVPQVTLNTAHATVRVVECRVADPDLGVGTESVADLHRGCATIRPFAPGPVDLGFPATEIVYEITARTPGRVRIEGAEVSYDDGGRAGHQHAGDGTLMIFGAKS
jgi:hypothetical protein